MFAVGRIIHMNKIDHDKTADAAQAELPGQLARRFEVCGQYGLAVIVRAGGSPAVNVDRGQRLGRLDDDVASRGKIDARLPRGRDIILDRVHLEHIAAVVPLNTLLKLRQMASTIGFRVAQRRRTVNDDPLRANLDIIAQGAFHDAKVIIQGGWRLDIGARFGDFRPHRAEVLNIGGKVLRR